VANEEFYFWLQQKRIVGCFDDQSLQSSSPRLVRQPIMASADPVDNTQMNGKEHFYKLHKYCYMIDMIEVYKFLHDLYIVDRGILVMASSSITRGHNLKLSRLTCRSRIWHDYCSQRIVEYWNGLSSDVVNASSVNSFKGRLDKHWKEFMFSLELPKRTVTSCYWRTDRQKAIWPIKPQKMVNGGYTFQYNSKWDILQAPLQRKQDISSRTQFI